MTIRRSRLAKNAAAAIMNTNFLITTDSLETIASQANREHQLASDAACSALEHAARCGELLSKAKAVAGHGNFLPWLKENFAGSERTAQNYNAAGCKSAARCGFELRVHPRCR
jgi:hypothetical protein